MSFNHATWAIEYDGEITSTEKLVLISLAEWANDEGECWPSQATVAKRAKIARQTVVGVIGNLKRKGLIESSSRKGGATKYTLPRITKPVISGDKGGVTTGDKGVTTGDSLLNQSVEPVSNHSDTSYPHDVPTRSKRPRLTEDEAIQATQIAKLYPASVKLTRQELAVCRQQMAYLMKRKGWTLDQIEMMTQAFRDFVEDSAPRFRWGAIKFFSDEEKVGNPQQWRVLAGDWTWEDVHRWLGNSGIKPLIEDFEDDE